MINCNYCKRLRSFLLWPLLLLAPAAALLPGVVAAIDSVTLGFATAAAEGWDARGVTVTLGSPAAALQGFSLSAEQVTVAGMPEPVRDLTVQCPSFALKVHGIACERAAIDAVLPGLGRQRFSAAVAYEPATGAAEIEIDDLAIGDGRLAVKASLRNGRWQGEAAVTSVTVEALLALANTWKMPLPGITATGIVDGSAQARGAGALPETVEFALTLTSLTAGNEAGTLASDRLSLTMTGRLQRHEGWDFELSANSSAGQAYAEPVFLDFGIHAMELKVDGVLAGDGTVMLEHFAITHREVLALEGSARLDPAAPFPVTALDATIHSLTFPGIYASYLQPFLLGTSFKALETSGAISGRVVIAAGKPELVDLSIDALHLDDGTGRLALYGLGGAVNWRGGTAAGSPAPSQLSWQGGVLLGLDLGTTTLDFVAHDRDFELLRPTRLPLLDGAIEFDRFEVHAAGLPEMTFALDANVLPISVQRLSRAFGWPEFGGQLGGRISDLRLDEGVLTLATTLRAQVFDGRLEISDLKVEDPFGDWPRLYSSIDVYNLDLEQVTSAFSFGRITGRLSGYVNEMVLFDWMPVEFDLRLYTPPEDRSRHRISQRAVQNIGNLGGGGAGVGAALSSGFMSFFDEFNYDRLGISCRLENEVCLMDGVDPAPNGGYYLVKGRGIPRIDVIGNAARVDWPRLVAQLAAIAESEGPVVE